MWGGSAPPPTPPFKVGRIRGLRNDGPVHGARVWPWSMGPGLGPGPALVHGPRPMALAGRKQKNYDLLLAKECLLFLGFHFNGSWKL